MGFSSAFKGLTMCLKNIIHGVWMSHTLAYCVLRGEGEETVDNWYDIFVNCSWVATRWQKYSTHLHTNSSHPVAAVQYSTHLHTNSSHPVAAVQYSTVQYSTVQYSTVHIYTQTVATQWQQYSTHLHTNSSHQVAAVQYTFTHKQ
jgi:hypothetical protein